MNVLFDLDGTLTDPKVGILGCIDHALVALGKPKLEGDANWCIGPPLGETFGKLLATDDEDLIKEAIAKYRERFGTVGMFENEVIPGVPEALSALRELGFRLFVATSKPEVYAKAILAHFGLDDRFAGIYGSELSGVRSNKAELIAWILEKENLAPETCVMVGDRIHDQFGASANTVRFVGVLYGCGSAEELRGADALCRSAEDLPGAIRGLFSLQSPRPLGGEGI